MINTNVPEKKQGFVSWIDEKLTHGYIVCGYIAKVFVFLYVTLSIIDMVHLFPFSVFFSQQILFFILLMTFCLMGAMGFQRTAKTKERFILYRNFVYTFAILILLPMGLSILHIGNPYTSLLTFMSIAICFIYCVRFHYGEVSK